jgi:pimeloyl-ACP methyl ester carboxylesterase
MKHWLALAALVVMSGCPEAASDSGETQNSLPPLDGPTVEFDPANAIIPFPNNLVINPATGKVTIPAPACETPAAKQVREGVLNTLDGFGTYEAAMQVTFTDDVDLNTLNGNVVMYQRTKMGNPVAPSPAAMVPVQVSLGTALRFNAADCAAPPAQVHAVTIVPMVPLDQKSTYTVALLDGIKTTSGKPYIPSFTWALVRQSTDPVQLADGCDYANPTSCTVVSEQTPLNPAGDANNNGVPDIIEIVGLDQLWKAHATGLAFLDANGHDDRSKILVAWEVTTQTVTDPLDPTFPDSPAASLMTGAMATTHSVTGNVPTRNFLEGAYQQLLGLSAQDAQTLCTNIGCDNVGDVLGAGLGVVTYQTHVANAWSGMSDIPGPWSDPVKPEQQDSFTVPNVGIPGVVPVLAFVPAGTPPANGWPVVVFGHGLGSQKESLFVFAPQLATAGFASVAIDFVDHGDRAVRFTADPALGCAGHCQVSTTTSCQHDSDCGTETCVLPSFNAANQCFAPFLSTDLAGTRDNIRQTVLDLQRLTHAVKSCGTTACGSFKVDPAHVVYAGISLGGIIGSTTTAVDDDLVASVLNVPGVGLLDILENSQTLEIKCPLVNGLIDAGIVQGTKWDPANPTVGTCLTDDWKMQPGYQQFAGIARIVLDPADGANFTSKLAMRRFLIQEVIGDKVVPNIATEREGALVGLMPQQADPMTAPTDPPSAAILGNSPPTTAMANKWLQYPAVPADAGNGFPGNTFQHGSLLSPAPGPAGQLGTARVQKDAITFLLFNK